MFDSNSYALNYINCFLIFLVFILQYHPDKNVIQNRQKQATIIFQVFTNHIGQLMKHQSQTQQSDQSQSSQNSYPPTQESSESAHFGAGYNEDHDSFYKDFEEDFEEETEFYYDPDYLRKMQKKEEKEIKNFLKRKGGNIHGKMRVFEVVRGSNFHRYILHKELLKRSGMTTETSKEFRNSVEKKILLMTWR